MTNSGSSNGFLRNPAFHLAELENAQGNEEMTDNLMAELESLYRVETGIIGSEEQCQQQSISESDRFRLEGH